MGGELAQARREAAEGPAGKAQDGAGLADRRELRPDVIVLRLGHEDQDGPHPEVGGIAGDGEAVVGPDRTAGDDRARAAPLGIGQQPLELARLVAPVRGKRTVVLDPEVGALAEVEPPDRGGGLAEPQAGEIEGAERVGGGGGEEGSGVARRAWPEPKPPSSVTERTQGLKVCAQSLRWGKCSGFRLLTRQGEGGRRKCERMRNFSSPRVYLYSARTYLPSLTAHGPRERGNQPGPRYGAWRGATWLLGANRAHRPVALLFQRESVS